MNDVLGQLAEANPVEADELAPLGFPTLVRRPPARRIALAIAVVATAIAATLVGVFAFGRSPAGPPATGVMGPTGATGPQMLRHPIGAANEVTLAEAASAIGQPVVLPDTSLVGPADVGHVWAFGHGANGIVAVTYPAQSVIIEERPWPYSDPANAYAKVTQEVPGSTVIEVGETQVLAIPQNPDEQEFGHIVFDISGLRIEVYGPYDQATLRAIAQSIVDQTQTSGGTNVVPCCAMTTRISLRHASALLGGPVPLPSHSLLTTARATEVGDCRQGGPSGCAIEVALLGQPRSLVYERGSTLWRPTPSTPVFTLDGLRVAEFRASRLRIRPATWVMSFVIAGTRVEVAGRRDFVRALAKSIIDRWHSR